MSQTNQRIRVDHWIAAILLFTMASIAFINVLSRYLFHFSFAATEEITINLFVWLPWWVQDLPLSGAGRWVWLRCITFSPKNLKDWPY